MNAIRASLVKRFARFALSGWLPIGAGIHAVYGLCKYSCGCCFSHPPGAAKQVCVSKLPALNRIFKRSSYAVLANQCRECGRTVFYCRNNKLFHIPQKEEYFLILRTVLDGYLGTTS